MYGKMLNEDEPTYLITPTVYFVVALQGAVAISIIEALAIAINPAAAPIIYPAGWIFIFGYMFWRARGLYHGFMKANRPTVATYIGCLALAGMASGFLYLCVTLPLSVSMPSPAADGAMWRIK